MNDALLQAWNVDRVTVLGREQQMTEAILSATALSLKEIG
jgi:hypothetical protein